MRTHVNQAAIALAMLLTGALVASLLSISSTASAAEAGESQVRASFQLPKLFDFEHFQQLFKKSYSSLAESLVRKKLFLARALKVFLSAVSYKHRRSSSYLGINHMSDWTEEEVAKTHLSREVMEEWTGIAIQGARSDVENELVDEEDIKSKLADILQHQDSEPGYKEIADELRQHQNSRRRRRRDASDDLRDLPVENLIGNPQVEFEKSERIKSNNKDYVQAEITSLGSDRYGAKTEFQPPLEPLIKSLKSSGFVVSHIKDLSELLQRPIERTADKSVDEVYFDHRDSGCLFAPRRQSSCGSCYAFAAVTLYEWSYCVATNGKKVALSEQYVVDCGDRSGMHGCAGGIFVKMSHFANNYGHELRQHYPYRSLEDTCPYEASTKPKSMGYLRTRDRGFYTVPAESFERILPLSPILIGISVNKNFQMYRGGVDEPTDCDKELGHAMVVIGHGREDGKEYWLIRNSYGVDWGVAGYYKLSKKLTRCIEPQFGYVLRSFEIVEGPGARQVSQDVSDRYTAYLMKDGDGLLDDKLEAKPHHVVQSANLHVNKA